MHGMKWCGVLSFILVSSVCVASAQESIPDYSRGFESFYALGLPDVKNATYVRLDKQSSQRYDAFRRYGEKGPAIAAVWLLEETAEEVGEVLVGGINRLTVISRRKWQEEQEARMKAAMAAQAEEETIHIDEFDYEPASQRQPGSWEPADLQADAAQLVAFLAALEMDGSNQSTLQRQSGNLFLLAIHLHRSGAKDEANQIAHLLFQKAGGQQAVIEAALSLLADSRYADLYRAFIANRDWQALNRGIEALAKQFARGWQRRDAVLQAASTLAPRLAGTPPTLPAEGLDETDQALATELAALDKISPRAVQDINPYSSTLWILPSATPSHGMRPSTATETNVLERIKARGMESIPLLIALLDDSYPTVLDNPNGNVNSFTQNTYYYSSGSRSPQAQARMNAQRTAQFYQSLPRPMTRGEIAAALLQQVVPAARNAMQRSPDEDARTEVLRNAATTWYEANKAKSGIELALGYLDDESGDMSFAQHAVLMYIAREGGSNELALVEQKLLESEPMQGASMAMQYAQLRGDDARPFVEKYIAYLKAPVAPPPSGDGDTSEEALFVSGSSRMGGNEKWMERMIQQFEILLENASLADLLESLVNGEKKLNHVSQFLYQAAARETPAKTIELLLDAAIRAKDVTTTMTLVGMVQSIPYSRMENMAHAGSPAPEQEKITIPQPKDHRELWLKLLADNRKPSNEEATMWGGTAEQFTIAAMAAYAIEALSAADSGPRGNPRYRDMDSYAILGTRLIPLLIERATLLVNGTDATSLPPLPDAANVSETNRTAIVQKLLATESTADLRAALDALGMDEYLAIMEHLADNDELRDHLAPLASLITSVSIEVADENAKASLEALSGSPFSRKNAEQIFETVKQLSPGGEPAIMAAVQRSPGLHGYSITIRQIDKGPKGGMYFYMRQAQMGSTVPMITGMLYSEDEHAEGRWKIETVVPKEETASEEKPKSEAETRRQKLLDMMLASGQDIPAEAIAMLEQMSDADLEDMDIGGDVMFDEEDNNEFWESIDRLCNDKENATGQVMLTFISSAPKPKGEDDEDEDFDDMMYDMF